MSPYELESWRYVTYYEYGKVSQHSESDRDRDDEVEGGDEGYEAEDEKEDEGDESEDVNEEWEE